MYQKLSTQESSASPRSKSVSKELKASGGYGSLSEVVQRAQREPSQVGEEELQQLDSAVGTRATGEMLARGKNPMMEFKGLSTQLWGNTTVGGVPIQTKLTIGAVGDKYEQEADRVAARVVKQINRPAMVSSAQGEMVQGKEQEEEEELRMKPMVQGKEAMGGGEASTGLESAINHAKGSGRPLDAGLQGSMEQAMGADFSGVRVHADSNADILNRSLSARAFTTGQDIFFRQGAYQPSSQGGRELLAHELTHVIQQGSGIVQRYMSNQRLSINRKSDLEHGGGNVTGTQISMREDTKYSTTRTNILNRRNRTAGGTSAALQAPIGVSMKKTRLHCQSSPILQCAPVQTEYGTFEDQEYTAIDEDKAKGVRMILTFDPGENVDARKIGMVQSVHTYLGNVLLQVDPEEYGKVVTDDGISKGYKVDRLPGATNPIYGAKNLEKDEDLSATPKTDYIGQNPKYKLGWNYTTDSDEVQHQKALLDDRPILHNFVVPNDSGQVFESTALAIAGEQKGMYYGSVSWGWTVDKSGNYTKEELREESKANPTRKFMDAAEKWNAFELSPKVEKGGKPKVYRTTEPLDVGLEMKNDDIEPRVTLATGTRFKKMKPERGFEVRIDVGTSIKYTEATNFYTFDFPLNSLWKPEVGKTTEAKYDTPIQYGNNELTISSGTKVSVKSVFYTREPTAYVNFSSGTIEFSEHKKLWLKKRLVNGIETTKLPMVDEKLDEDE